MNKNRLLKLARFLEELPNQKVFDIGSWQAKPQKRREGRKPGQCGFVGCAMGWAAHQKMFPGLSLVPVHPKSKYVMLGYKGLEDWEAAAAVFDITGTDYSENSDVDYLFGGSAYDRAPYYGSPTPFDVARRIRRFIKDGGSHAETTSFHN